jgi:NTE family protein
MKPLKPRHVLLGIALFVSLALAAQTPPATPTQPAHRTRVALALSGGGSLGLAHIGVLQYFEEHHIPVDAIAGTSMGGIVGGLYATGHSPEEIERSFSDAGWEELLRAQPHYRDLPIASRQDRTNYPGDYALRLGHGLSLPAGLSTAEALDLFLSRQVLAYSAVEDFGLLPTAFRCVATQLQTGEAFVLKRGNLARAIRATMSVPGIFTPVEWDGRVLVDGGLVDNLPTDVARDMGADVVIAVHFSLPVPPKKELESLTNVLTQAVSVAVYMTEREALRNADLVLAPSLVGIGGTDYTHARELIERGYQAAAQKERFLATLALNDADWAAYLAERRSRMKPIPQQATRLVAKSSDASLARHAQAELDRDGGSLTLPEIEHELSTLVAASALPGAFYRLPAVEVPASLAAGQAGANQAAANQSTTHPSGATQSQEIIAEVAPRAGSQLFIRPSLQLAVANAEPTRGALLGFVTVLPQDAYRARYRVQGAIGYSPRLEAEYEYPLAASHWFWSPSLELQRQNSATYSGDQHFTHWQDSYSGAFDFGYWLGQRLRLRAGVEAGYERLSGVQFAGALATGDGAFVAPRLRAEWNSLDEAALPTRGTLFTGSITARYRSADGRTVPLARAALEEHFPLAAGTLTLALGGASSFGTRLNYFDLFPLGGSTDLRAFRYEQFHVLSYGLGELAYRRPFGEFKLLGQRPQLGAWYDAAGLRQPLQSWQSAQSGSVGVLLNSPVGVVTFAVGYTGDHQTRAWINVGRP